MARFDFGGRPVRDEVVGAFEDAWEEIAGPGTWLTAEQRVAVAERTRGSFEGRSARFDLAGLAAEAGEAVDLLASRPADTSEEWVGRIVDAMGEFAYVELAGIVARVTAIDTFCRLLGVEPVRFPPPTAGEPTREPPPENLRRNKTWVSMQMPVPPFVLGAVPAAMDAMNDVSVPLYMTMEEMGDPTWRRGELDRAQVELVAGATSHVNECFY